MKASRWLTGIVWAASFVVSLLDVGGDSQFCWQWDPRSRAIATPQLAAGLA